MDIDLGAAVRQGRPSNQLVRRLDDDHTGLVIGQVEGLLDIGWMDFGHAVIRDLARTDEGGNCGDVGPCRSPRRQAQKSRQGHVRAKSTASLEAIECPAARALSYAVGPIASGSTASMRS